MKNQDWGGQTPALYTRLLCRVAVVIFFGRAVEAKSAILLAGKHLTSHERSSRIHA